jgi:hypothetical protein
MRACVLAFGLAVLLAGAAPTPAVAQETRADTAAVLVAAARRLAAEGERNIATSSAGTATRRSPRRPLVS